MQVHGARLSHQQHRKTSRSRPCVEKGLQAVQTFQEGRNNEKVIMAQYIDKAAVVAEIEDKINKYTKRGEESDAKRDGYGMYWGGVLSCLNEVRSFLDTIEVKEVDLEAEERMKECPFRQVGCTMYEGKVLECRGACSWVVDYPKLKELKAKHKED